MDDAEGDGVNDVAAPPILIWHAVIHYADGEIELIGEGYVECHPAGLRIPSNPYRSGSPLERFIPWIRIREVTA